MDHHLNNQATCTPELLIWHSIPSLTRIRSKPQTFRDKQLFTPISHWGLSIITSQLYAAGLSQIAGGFWNPNKEPALHGIMALLSRTCRWCAASLQDVWNEYFCTEINSQVLMVSPQNLSLASERNGLTGGQWRFEELPLFPSNIHWRRKPSSATWHGPLSGHCPRRGMCSPIAWRHTTINRLYIVGGKS